MAGLRAEAVPGRGRRVPAAVFLSEGPWATPSCWPPGSAPDRAARPARGPDRAGPEDGRHPAMLAREIDQPRPRLRRPERALLRPALRRAGWPRRSRSAGPCGATGEADSDGPALPGARGRQPAPAGGRAEPARRPRPDGRRRAARRPRRPLADLLVRPATDDAGGVPRGARVTDATLVRERPDTAGRRPPSPAGTCRPSTACGRWPSSASWPTTSNSAGRRGATWGSTSSSCCRASSSPPSCWRSGSGTGRVNLAGVLGPAGPAPAAGALSRRRGAGALPGAQWRSSAGPAPTA